MNVSFIFIIIIINILPLSLCRTRKTTTSTTVNLSKLNVSLENSGIKTINGSKYYKQKFEPVKLRQTFRKNFIATSTEYSKEAVKCETPNNDTGRCQILGECSVLNNVKDKKQNEKFLNESICLNSNPIKKYCCGKYENYKHLLPKRPLPKLCGYQYMDLLKKGKIFGGKEAKLGEFPWLARIIHTNQEEEKSVGCEGFLIHKRFILTAAHCVRAPRIALIGNITEIQLGEHNTSTENDCVGLKCAEPLQTMKVKSIIPHPEYRHNSRDHHYDIALIYLKGEVKFTDYVQPICLSEKNVIPENYWISGWGKTENGTYSEVKMKVSIPPFDSINCNKLYSRLNLRVGQSQFCAGGVKNKDSCVGDSGGPLMFSNNESRWFAVGLVSYGANCGREGWPGVYTSIPFFYEWLSEEIIKLREPDLLIDRSY